MFVVFSTWNGLQSLLRKHTRFWTSLRNTRTEDHLSYPTTDQLSKERCAQGFLLRIGAGFANWWTSALQQWKLVRKGTIKGDRQKVDRVLENGQIGAPHGRVYEVLAWFRSCELSTSDLGNTNFDFLTVAYSHQTNSSWFKPCP